MLAGTACSSYSIWFLWDDFVLGFGVYVPAAPKVGWDAGLIGPASAISSMLAVSHWILCGTMPTAHFAELTTYGVFDPITLVPAQVSPSSS